MEHFVKQTFWELNKIFFEQGRTRQANFIHTSKKFLQKRWKEIHSSRNNWSFQQAFADQTQNSGDCWVYQLTCQTNNFIDCKFWYSNWSTIQQLLKGNLWSTFKKNETFLNVYFGNSCISEKNVIERATSWNRMQLREALRQSVPLFNQSFFRSYISIVHLKSS